MDYKPDQNENQEMADAAAPKQELTDKGIASMQGAGDAPERSFEQINDDIKFYEKNIKDCLDARNKTQDPQLKQGYTDVMQTNTEYIDLLHKEKEKLISKKGLKGANDTWKY